MEENQESIPYDTMEIGGYYEMSTSSYYEIKMGIGMIGIIRKYHVYLKSIYYIIAADTFISFNNKCLGKPFTKEKQREMLASFSGHEVQVITGIYVCNAYTGQIWNETISSDLCFKHLTEEQIERYIGTEEGLDKAGGFALQGKGNILIDHIRGDWYNILGLPLSRIYDIFQSCGVFVD